MARRKRRAEGFPSPYVVSIWIMSIRSTEKYLVTYTADTRCTAGRQGSLSDLGGRD